MNLPPRPAEFPLITPEALLGASDVSYWLKDALRSALKRDPMDAAADAELLAEVLRRRCESALS